MDNFKRDRFELLSAYLDGEVTAAERRQVEEWLSTDPSVQQLYARLLKLRQGMRSLSVPAPECSAEETVKEVFTKLERRPKRVAAWGGLAIAAMLVGALSTVMTPTPQYTVHQLAELPQKSKAVANSEGLKIALDRPVIDIPNVSAIDAGVSPHNTP